jgi:hypothetical protein
MTNEHQLFYDIDKLLNGYLNDNNLNSFLFLLTEVLNQYQIENNLE